MFFQVYIYIYIFFFFFFWGGGAGSLVFVRFLGFLIGLGFGV